MVCGIYKKPKREDVVAGSFENAGIEVFNPEIKTEKSICKAHLEIKISPLFPCYVFENSEPETTSHMIKYTRGVRRIVGGDYAVACFRGDY